MILSFSAVYIAIREKYRTFPQVTRIALFGIILELVGDFVIK